LTCSAGVRAGIRVLQDAAAQSTVLSIRSRMAWLQSIIDADPSELQSIVGGACRWCGGNGGYHYRNAAELAKLLEAHLTSKGSKPLPATMGAYGYRGDAEANPDCSECDGRGITEAIITPSDQWSPAARALFAGIKHKPDGKLEIQMVSKLAAADMLSKLQGAYVERSINVNANVTVPPLKDLSHDEALQFLDSLRAAT
jgi:phage terminase small subunit